MYKACSSRPGELSSSRLAPISIRSSVNAFYTCSGFIHCRLLWSGCKNARFCHHRRSPRCATPNNSLQYGRDVSRPLIGKCSANCLSTSTINAVKQGRPRLVRSTVCSQLRWRSSARRAEVWSGVSMLIRMRAVQQFRHLLRLLLVLPNHL